LRTQLGSEPDPLTQQLFAQLDSASQASDAASPDTSMPLLQAAGTAAVSSNARASLVTAGRSRELELLLHALQAAAKASSPHT
jgi:hypothetical protein